TQPRSAGLWKVVPRVDAVAGAEIDQGILALLQLNPEAPLRCTDIVVGHLVGARWNLFELVVAVTIGSNMEADSLGLAILGKSIEMVLIPLQRRPAWAPAQNDPAGRCATAHPLVSGG